MLTTSHGLLLQLLLQNTPHTYSHLSKQHNHCTKKVMFCTNVFFAKKAPYLLCWWVVHSRCETEAQCVRYPMHYCKYSVPVLEERNYPTSSQALLSNITNPTPTQYQRNLTTALAEEISIFLPLRSVRQIFFR